MMLLVVANRLPGKVAFILCNMAYQRSHIEGGLVSTGPHFGAP